MTQTTGRLLFAEGSDEGFRRLLEKLNLNPAVLRKRFTEDVRKIEAIDFLTSDERLLGFDRQWSKGRVELVLHPASGGSDQQRDFLAKLFHDLKIPLQSARMAFYGEGSAFVSVPLDKQTLEKLGDCVAPEARPTPTSSAHPAEPARLDRRTNGAAFPQPNHHSRTIVGANGDRGATRNRQAFRATPRLSSREPRAKQPRPRVCSFRLRPTFGDFGSLVVTSQTRNVQSCLRPNPTARFASHWI